MTNGFPHDSLGEAEVESHYVNSLLAHAMGDANGYIAKIAYESYLQAYQAGYLGAANFLVLLTGSSLVALSTGCSQERTYQINDH